MSDPMAGGMNWFGLAPFSPICDLTAQVPIPVGEICGWCDEPIEDGQNGYIPLGERRPHHHECFVRMIFGSVAHQTKRCSCFGGNESDDDSRLSKRDNAVAAFVFAQAFPFSQ